MQTAVAVDSGSPGTAPPNQCAGYGGLDREDQEYHWPAVQNIGTRNIDGVDAKGYLLSEQGMEYTVWADALASRCGLRFRWTCQASDDGGDEQSGVR